MADENDKKLRPGSDQDDGDGKSKPSSDGGKPEPGDKPSDEREVETEPRDTTDGDR